MRHGHVERLDARARGPPDRRDRRDRRWSSRSWATSGLAEGRIRDSVPHAPSTTQSLNSTRTNSCPPAARLPSGGTSCGPLSCVNIPRVRVDPSGERVARAQRRAMAKPAPSSADEDLAMPPEKLGIDHPTGPAPIRPRVSVVVPTYNGAKNLPHVFALLPPDVHEVILVEVRSVDGTIEVPPRCGGTCASSGRTGAARATPWPAASPGSRGTSWSCSKPTARPTPGRSPRSSARSPRDPTSPRAAASPTRVSADITRTGAWGNG